MSECQHDTPVGERLEHNEYRQERDRLSDLEAEYYKSFDRWSLVAIGSTVALSVNAMLSAQSPDNLDAGWLIIVGWAFLGVCAIAMFDSLRATARLNKRLRDALDEGVREDRSQNEIVSMQQAVPGFKGIEVRNRIGIMRTSVGVLLTLAWTLVNFAL